MRPLLKEPRSFRLSDKVNIQADSGRLAIQLPERSQEQFVINYLVIFLMRRKSCLKSV
ncbi:MAG: hypothetical protein ACJAXW_002188 [Candidatus Azotimanducaceae bacterium]|jgi:hypothetical protein